VDYSLPGSWLLQTSFYGLAAAILIAVNHLLRRASLSCGDPPQAAGRLQRRFQLGAALWVVAVAGVSFSGVINPLTGPPFPFGLLMASILVLGILVARSEVGDRLARGLPLAYLVGFQAFRFPLELAMHRAYSEGVMPLQMSYSGRNFDIVTGITALVLGGVLMVRPVPKWIVTAWNVLGLALLVNILAVALASTPIVAYWGPDRLNVFVARMPYTLLPAVMVLAAWAGHLIVFRALTHRA
jgi:hypothetical protein